MNSTFKCHVRNNIELLTPEIISMLLNFLRVIFAELCKSKSLIMPAMNFEISNADVREAPVKTKPDVDTEVLLSVDANYLEDSYVYVHCYFNNPGKDAMIRIWRSTFLVDTSSQTRVSLVHAENITFAPLWTLIPDGRVYSFLLIFSGLPKSCRQFDLVEDIPQAGGFLVKNIVRNERDVYHVDIC